jgi:hypothetical protein
MPAPLAGVPNPCDSQGPPGPEGPPGDCSGCLTDFADVVTSAGASGLPASLFQLFAEETQLVGPLNADLLTPTVLAMDSDALSNLCNYLVNEETPTFFPAPVLICDSTTPSHFLTANTGEGPHYELANPCITGGNPMDVDTVTLQVERCDTNGLEANIEKTDSITFASVKYVDPASGEVFDMLPIFSVILDKLDSLLKCCPPCDKGRNFDDMFPVDNPNPSVQMVGTWLAPQPSVVLGNGIDEVMIDNLVFATAIDTELAPPDMGKLGRFYWIYDCALNSEPDFLNLSSQRMHPGSGNAVGFGYHLARGLSCQFHIKYSARPGFGQW